MFQKKDIIFSETLGVCKVEDITKLSLAKGDTVLYYVLRSVFQKEKIAYIPVEHHQVVLRDLLTPEQAKEIKEHSKSEVQELQKQEIDYVLEIKE